MSDSINVDTLIDDFGGLGCFQILLLTLTSGIRIVPSMSVFMMAFGNYNPGWQCLNNSTRNEPKDSMLNGSKDIGECRLYDACSNVQFAPEVSTVVTEWELICEKSWIPSLIISIQMAGLLLGSILSGYLADKFGRKRILIAVSCYHAVVNLIAIFSSSWYMFAVMRFLIGIAIPFMLYLPVVLSIEFVPHKWRTFSMCFPTFAFGCTIVAISAMTTRDWKYVQGIISVLSFITIIPVYWTPESLRWLVINHKLKDAVAVVRSMAKLNGKTVNALETVENLTKNYNHQCKSQSFSSLHVVRQLFRRGLRYTTITVGVVCLSMSMMYYAISFGAKSLSGNFYINLLILSTSEIPYTPVSALLPNYTGRRISMMIFIVVCMACLFCAAGLELATEGSLKSIGVLICVTVTRANIEAAWDTAVTYTGEVYPTVMRSTSMLYASWIARIGGIAAPYLIPNNSDSYYISYLIMALFALVCCILVIFLQETNKKPLTDVWETSVPMEDACAKESAQQEGGDNAQVRLSQNL